MDNIIYINNRVNDLHKEDILITESKTGNRSVRYNNFYLNSHYNPLKEAKRLVSKHYQKNHAHVLFGIGYGYLAKEFLTEIREDEFLLIIEPSLNLFKQVKNNPNLSGLYNHPRVFFIIGFEEKQIDEEIKYLITSKYMAQVELIVSPNYDRIYPRLIDSVEEIIKKNVKLSLVNLGTMAVFSKIWQKNLLYNVYGAWESTPYKKFQKRFTCPVIIVSSGPSLTKQLDLLKTVREQSSALIIAAGSTLNPLLNAGIKPHLVVSIDGGEPNWEHFKNINYDDVPLFYSFTCHREIPRNHNGLKVVFNNGDEGLAEWVNQTVGTDIGFVVGGASVANFCLYIAQSMTSGTITFIGQDLGYTNNYTHAEGNKHFKKINQNKIEKNKMYTYVTGYYGDEVLTSYQFLSMKRVFEEMVTIFRNHGDQRQIYNSTEGGVLIEGIKNISFSDFVKENCNENYSDVFQEVFISHEVNTKQKERIVSKLLSEKEKLGEIIKLSKKAKKMLDGISRETVLTDIRILSKLDMIDEKLNKYLGSNIIYYITMPVYFRVNHLYQEKDNESPLDKTKRILNKSDALYKGIIEAAETTIEILEIVIEEDQ
ncbi:motility associated factor glycosyltransferase family protein [Bacillus sp. AK031]